MPLDLMGGYPASWVVRVESLSPDLPSVLVLTLGDGTWIRLTPDEVRAICAVARDHKARALTGATTWRKVPP